MTSLAEVQVSESASLRVQVHVCSQTLLSSSGREVAMFTVPGLFPLQSVTLLMPCHVLLVLLVMNCSSTLFLYCRLAALMDILRS